jgi:catechol 2,3-dioxygenase-like lactoylglutathione lyase family enzyme
MNTETIVHPKLHHLGLTTANLEVMLEWYRKVLGMTLVHRSAAPVGGQQGRRGISKNRPLHRLQGAVMNGRADGYGRHPFFPARRLLLRTREASKKRRRRPWRQHWLVLKPWDPVSFRRF